MRDMAEVIPKFLLKHNLGGTSPAILGEGFCLAKTFRFEARLDKKLGGQRNEIFCSRLPKAGRSISSARIYRLGCQLKTAFFTQSENLHCPFYPQGPQAYSFYLNNY